MSDFKLRDYQQEAIDDVMFEVEMNGIMEKYGCSNIVVSAPTSWGKSAFAAGLAKELADSGYNVAIVVNITPLISQIEDHLIKIGVEDFSVLKAGMDEKFDPASKIQLIMSQTMDARKSTLDHIKADVIIQDEIHKEYRTKRSIQLIRHLNAKLRVGLSGTPYDAKGYALEGVETTIETKTILELEKDGYVVPVKYYVTKWAEDINYDKLDSSSTGDFTVESIEDLIGTKEYAKNVYKAMKQLGIEHEKNIIFCASIAHADLITGVLRKKGIKAYSYHSKNDSKAQSAAIASFEGKTEPGLVDDEEITTLVSVTKVAIGYDYPGIQNGIICRPTKVLSLYRQMVGRVIRKNKDKSFGCILDLAGCVGRFGFHSDPYSPPAKGDKEALEKKKVDMLVPILSLLAKEDGEPTEVSREVVDFKIIEAQRKMLSMDNITVQEGIMLFESTMDLKTMVSIAAKIDFLVNGQTHKASTIDWIVEGLERSFSRIDSGKGRFIKATKTRAKNIIKQGKKLAALHYWGDWLIDNSYDITTKDKV